MSGNNLNNADTVAARVVNASDLMDTHRVRANIGDVTTLNATTGNIITVNADRVNAAQGDITTINATQASLTNINTTKITSSQTSAGALDASSASISTFLTADRIQLPGGPAPGSGELGASSVRTSNWFRSHGATGWYNESYGGGWYMVDGTWIRAYNGKSVHTPGTMQARNVVSENRATVGEYLQINGVATEGHGCGPNGLVARDSTGMMLSCQSGVWSKASSISNVTRVVGPPGSADINFRLTSIAACPVNTTVISGGCSFVGPGNNWWGIHPGLDEPHGTGWICRMHHNTYDSSRQVRAHAMCVK